MISNLSRVTESHFSWRSGAMNQEADRLSSQWSNFNPSKLCCNCISVDTSELCIVLGD